MPGSIGTVVGGMQTFIGITTNAGKARFQGVEFEGNAVLARDFGSDGDRLNFAWSLGYINADYLEFQAPVFFPLTGQTVQVDVADLRRIQNTPEWTASGTLNYEVPVAGGRLNFVTTVSYRSSTQQFELAIPGLDQAGYALWDANLVWRSDNDRWTIGLHGRNLTDKRYITSGYNFLRQNGGPAYTSPNGQAVDTGDFILPNGHPGLSSTLGAQGVLTAFYGNPRQVYLTVGFNFR